MKLLLISITIAQVIILVMLAKTEMQQAASIILFNIWLMAAITYKE